MQIIRINNTYLKLTNDYYFTPSELFTPANAGDLSQES